MDNRYFIQRIPHGVLAFGPCMALAILAGVLAVSGFIF